MSQLHLKGLKKDRKKNIPSPVNHAEIGVAIFIYRTTTFWGRIEGTTLSTNFTIIQFCQNLHLISQQNKKLTIPSINLPYYVRDIRSNSRVLSSIHHCHGTAGAHRCQINNLQMEINFPSNFLGISPFIRPTHISVPDTARTDGRDIPEGLMEGGNHHVAIAAEFFAKIGHVLKVKFNLFSFK
jgi:hypothetical protein